MSLPQPNPNVIAGDYCVPRPRGPIDLWLDGNEGPRLSRRSLSRLAELDGETLRRYPDASGLERGLADRLQCSAERVLVTAGADEAIDRFCRAYLVEGRNLVVLAPAFEMTTRYAALAGAEVREVWWSAGAFPLDDVLAAIDERTCAIAIATPNNPTGLVVPLEVLEELARRAPDVWLLLDLVYAGFLTVDPTPRLIALPNAIVVKSFSKSAGLAGLRVGYACGPVPVIAALRRAGGPYSVSGPSIALARAFLDEPEDESAASYRAHVRREREVLTDILRDSGATVSDATANFVLATTARADFLFDGLASLGIAVRRFQGRPGLEDSLRISCPGGREPFERLEHGLRTVLAPQALLFDLDGVLADVRESYRQAIVETAAGFGVTVSANDVANAKARGNANNDWVLTWRLIDRAAPLEDVTREFEARYQDSLWQRETPRVSRECLARLATTYRLGVVTGRPRADAARFLRTHELEPLFDCVVCMEDAPAKPAPDPVRLALQRLGCERAWMLGDTVDDVRAARRAGVVPVGVVAPGDDSAPSLAAAGAARVLTDPNTLFELLP